MKMSHRGCAWLILAGLGVAGCGSVGGVPLPNENDARPGEGFALVARFAQISDVHVVDVESPGRITPTYGLFSSSWRPQEAYCVHLFDGILRAVNLYHRRMKPIDFLLVTGDGVDNAQHNELDWMLATIDGRAVTPLSGPDDRPVEARGGPNDPYATFTPEGLDGGIPWYAVMGNHDRFAAGVFPIQRRADGGWYAPLPGRPRIGLFLPIMLIPDGGLAYGPVSPANPGPPPTVALPVRVPVNPERRYLTPADYVAAHFGGATAPDGHGFSLSGPTWYSVSPVPGLRLIVLDTSEPPVAVATAIDDGGGVTRAQVAFLSAALDAAQAAGEVAIVATHHPTRFFSAVHGSAISGAAFQELLAAHACVAAHICGHSHEMTVWDRGGYVEIETGSIIDVPQAGRIVEIWRRGAEVAVRYASFDHLYGGRALEGVPPDELPADPFLHMRRHAYELAAEQAAGGFQPKCGCGGK